MLYILGWLFIGLLMGLWSLFMWITTSVFSWTLASAGSLKAGGLLIPDSVRDWIPPELMELATSALNLLVAVFDTLLGLLPSLATATSVIGWTVWALGASFLLLAGAAGHLGVWLWRRHAATRPVTAARLAAG